jgi:hypothetical protein
MSSPAVLALSDSLKELLAIVFIVLIPTVPVTIFAWGFFRKRRAARGEAQEIESGRSPATPFAAISVVGGVIAVAAALTLLIVVAVRAVAA